MKLVDHISVFKKAKLITYIFCDLVLCILYSIIFECQISLLFIQNLRNILCIFNRVYQGGGGGGDWS